MKKSFIKVIGLPHTQKNQGNSGIFQDIENLRETQRIFKL